MRLVSFLEGRDERLGILSGNRVIDALTCAKSRGIDERAVTGLVPAIDATAKGNLDLHALFAEPPLEAIRDASSVKLRAPLRPSTILCAGSNYRAHNLEKANTPLSGKEPEFFVKTADCVIGPGDAIVHDLRLTRKLDCEAELAVVIGKSGRHIPSNAPSNTFSVTPS